MTKFVVYLFLLAATCCDQGRIWVRHIVVPNYPVLARMARLEGSVTVEAEFDANGNVTNSKGSGAPDLLIKAAESNLRQWTFGSASPTQRGRCKLTITYSYKLRGKEDYYDPSAAVTLDLPNRVEIVAHPARLQTSAARR
jgi:TonB family protein